MCPQPVQFFLYRTFFLVNPFFFFKILFNAFFFPQSAEILNFFFFFSASINKPVFFYKCATLKKRYVYNLSPLPTFFLKAKAVSNKLNVFFQNQESAYVNKAPSLRIKERMFSIRKTFLNFKKISLKNLFFFYKLKFLKRRNLFSFFSNFKKKSFVEIESFFSFNFLRILQRVFPFFNFFLLRKLLARGLILLNFKKVTNFFTRLRVGDFISIFFLNDL